MGPIGESALIILYYLPKESSLEPLRGVPLCEDAFSYFIRKKNPPPPPKIHSKTPYLLDGWLGGWVYLPFKKMFGKNVSFFFCIFFKYILRGNDYNFFSWPTSQK